jgi:UDP-N-acetylmuramoyl-L-alanyl-D-glutamate--2,6-diaminopimelate ligase
MKKTLKKLVPYFIFDFYYYLFAMAGAVIYGFPSRKMVVIGVTGTKGKTSTINYIWSTLTAGGKKVGLISTANIKIGNDEVLNKYHMTMPGRFAIQKLLADMARAGCTHCLVEVTSEGIKQHRHQGIIFDVAVFTNLTPEHLSSHGGSFQKYKETKGRLFSTLGHKRKIINNIEIPTVIIANADSEHAPFYLSFTADKKITYSINSASDCKAEKISEDARGVKFSRGADDYELSILGSFNIYNALPAIVISELFNLSKDSVKSGLKKLDLIPGRMEKINLGQKFTVLVDYAHEKQSMNYVLRTGRKIVAENGRVIVLLGAEGGGRDKQKRADMGELVGKFADYVFVTNVDPYEDDPKQIIEDIAVVAEKNGKVREKNLFTIEDRRTSIAQALKLAVAGDVVIITGKGAEQSIIIGGKSSAWDDRQVVREELGKII